MSASPQSSPLPVADLYLPATHAVHVRSCDGDTTVACVASAGGSSSALKRRVRVRGTGRAGFVRGRTKHPWDRARATPTVTRGRVDFPAVTNSPGNTLAHRHNNIPSQVCNYHQVHSAGTVGLSTLKCSESQWSHISVSDTTRKEKHY